jgi:hypothetical protein
MKNKKKNMCLFFILLQINLTIGAVRTDTHMVLSLALALSINNKQQIIDSYVGLVFSSRFIDL